MSANNDIPWNRKPKNGISAFFTETSFSKWLENDSHESRLAASLSKFCKGVILPKPSCAENKTVCAATNASNDIGLFTKDKTAAGDSRNTDLVKKDITTLHDEGLTCQNEIGKEGFEDSPVENKERDHDSSKSDEKLNVMREQSASFSKHVHGTGDQSLSIKTSAIAQKMVKSKVNTTGELDKEKDKALKLPTSPKLSPSKEEELDEVEKRKKAIQNNLLFFNDLERKDKYMPILARKKPRFQKASLTAAEQKTYLDLKRRFGKLGTSFLDPRQEADFRLFKELCVKVDAEQQKFMTHLRHAFKQCEDDYRYIHAEAEKYITEKLIVKKRRVTKYPRHYHHLKRINLHEMDDGREEIDDTSVTLQYVQPLLLLGTVPRMVLPQIIPGLPQPCTPTDCGKVTTQCPTVRNVVKGQCVWNHEECSQDVNAEQLAVPNKCDFVVTSSAMKHMVDNQDQQVKQWNIPIVVRDYTIQDGDKMISHKVVYVDKPLIKTSQYSVQDRNKLYQKYALKSVAIRPKHKPHVFANIKPSSEVVKYVTIEDLKKETEEYNQSVLDDKSSRASETDNDKPHQKKTHSRKNKDEKGTGKQQVGLFDIDNDIDDLETFGMEKSWKLSSSKLDKGSEILSGSRSGAPNETSKEGRRDGKSLESDLAMFKQELEGLKTRSLKSHVKSLDNERDTTNEPISVGQKETETDHEIDKSTEVMDSNVEETANIKEKQPDNVEDTSKGKPDEILDNPLKSKQTADAKNSSKKGGPSLSARLKQMSTIRSKLNMKPMQKELPSSGIGAKIQETTAGQSNGVGLNPAVVNKLIHGGNNVETESDGDSDDGLVIDVPETSLSQSVTIEVSPESPKQIGSPPASPTGSLPASPNEFDDGPCSPDTPESPTKTVGGQGHVQSKPCLMIPLEDDNADSVVRDYSIVKDEHSTVVNMEMSGLESNKPLSNTKFDTKLIKHELDIPDLEKAESATSQQLLASTMETDVVGVSTRGSKRRSIGCDSLEISPKRRILRSSKSTNVETIPTGPCTRRSSYTGTSPGIKEYVKQQNTSTDRMTRSRSSSEDVGKEDVSPLRRSKRHSIDMGKDVLGILQTSQKVKQKSPNSLSSRSLDESMETDENAAVSHKDNVIGTDTPVVPKRRGRPRKSAASVKGDTASETVEMGGKMQDVVNDSVTTDDDHEADTPKTAAKRKGRHPANKMAKVTKDETESESKKIREMAGAMKKRISQTVDVDANKDVKKEEEGCHQTGSKFSDNSNQLVKARQEGFDTNSAKAGTGSPNETLKPAETDKEKQGTSRQEGSLNLDNILSLQTKLWKMPENKEASGSFAAKHGMARVLYPLKDNITYHQWKLGDLNLLIRCSYHGFSNPQGFVHLTTKMEYQPYFGFEEQTVSDIAKNWMSAYIRPKCTLVRARINPYNSEIMMVDYVDHNDLVPPDSRFSPKNAMVGLHTIFKGLKDLPAGQYILNNNSRQNNVAVFQAVPEDERGQFDLHYYHATGKTYPKGKEPTHAKWIPIDTDLLLQHQKKMNLIPCTFNPNAGKQAKPKQAAEGQNKGKRRRKKKPKKKQE